MLSINTNLSSLIVQNSMNTSTSKLNQAIERMSTGFKINHASDNAANYSISTNMTTKIGAYQIAQSNAEMGMDLVTTASDIISLMQDKATRLHALSTQARNGTYGAQSLSAINTEASAIMAEINRLYSTAQYNGTSLFDKAGSPIAGFSNLSGSEPVIAKSEYNNFILDPVSKSQAQVEALRSIDSFSTGDNDEFKIMSADDLAKLANIVNSGQDTSNAVFYLGADIDLTQWQANNGDWIPIGDGSNAFQGVFDGNGHVIKNLHIENSEESQALFGVTESGSVIKNVGIKDAVVSVDCFGAALIGESNSTVDNCYAIGGSIYACEGAGGLVGYSAAEISNSYATNNVKAENYAGGFVAYLESNLINSYATGNVTATIASAGGLAAEVYDVQINNCYSTGTINAETLAGGLFAYTYASTITITNSFSAGEVNADTFVGGLLGLASNTDGTMTISNSASYSKVRGNDIDSTGTIIGGFDATYDGVTFGTLNISNLEVLSFDLNPVGGVYRNDQLITYDMTAVLAGINLAVVPNSSTILQIGINSDSSCQIGFDTNLSYDLSKVEADIASDSALAQITDFINLLSEKQTQLGAVQNRLESALDSISVNIENLVSSRSTLRDADIAEVSSHYIQQQILQQASATLMATANQSPSIALQLI